MIKECCSRRENETMCGHVPHNRGTGSMRYGSRLGQQRTLILQFVLELLI